MVVKSIKTCMVVVGVMLASSFAQAGDGGGNGPGNGGDAVVWRNANGKIKKAVLLDFFEAEGRGIKYDLGGPELDVMAKVNLALSRLERLDPVRAKEYRESADGFFENAKMLNNVNLTDINDSLENMVPNGAAIEQLAIREYPRFKEDKLYTINNDIFDAMDADNKAGLILHEITYGEARDYYGHDNSRLARYANSYLASAKFKSMSMKEYLAFRETVMMPDIAVLFPNGAYAYCGHGSELEYDKNMDAWRCSKYHTNRESRAMINGRQIGVSGDDVGGVYFYENGQLASGILSETVSVQSQGKEIPCRWESLIEFYKNGTLRHCSLAKDTSINVHGVNLLFSSTVEVSNSYPGYESYEGGTVFFHENGELMYGVLSEDADVIFTIQNKQVSFAKGTHVDFYENGNLASGIICVRSQDKEYTLMTDSEKELLFGGRRRWSPTNEEFVLVYFDNNSMISEFYNTSKNNK